MLNGTVPREDGAAGADSRIRSHADALLVHPRTLYVLALAWLFVPAVLHALQPGSRVRPPPLARVEGGTEIRTALCAGCSIRLEQVGRIGSLDGPDALSELAVIAYVAGEMIVSDQHAGGAISRFSLTGSPLAHYTRSGMGPGELRSVHRMRIGAGDTLYVSDGVAYIHRFDPRGGFVDQRRVSLMPTDFLPLSGDTVVIAAVGRTAAVAGYPLHVFDRTGLLTSLGGQHVATPRSEIALNRVLAHRRAGGVWAAHQMDYVLEAWNLAGRRTEFLTRRPPWFLFWSGVAWPANIAPPASSISAIDEDEEGLVWVILNVADRNWQPIPSGAAVTRTERRGFAQEHADRLFDTVIEVIDPRRARVIAQGRSDRKLTGIGSRYFYSYEVSESGAPIYRIWRAHLTRTGG
jgi:hypothetical protein